MKKSTGTSLAILWLRLHASNAGGMGSIPGQGIKIPHAVQHGQEIKKKKGFETVCLTLSTILLSELMKRNSLFLLDTCFKNCSEFYPIAKEGLGKIHFLIHAFLHTFIHLSIYSLLS